MTDLFRTLTRQLINGSWMGELGHLYNGVFVWSDIKTWILRSTFLSINFEICTTNRCPTDKKRFWRSCFASINHRRKIRILLIYKPVCKNELHGFLRTTKREHNRSPLTYGRENKWRTEQMSCIMVDILKSGRNKSGDWTEYLLDGSIAYSPLPNMCSMWISTFHLFGSE